MDAQSRDVATAIAARYAALVEVEAVALAGSRATGFADQASDLDLDVFWRALVPIDSRRAIALERSADAEVDNRFWESGDEWVEADSGLAVDVVFRDVRWIEGELDRVLVRHEAAVGWTTCIWHSVRTASPLFDHAGWFAALHRRARQPYPEQLCRAIVAKNHPLLARARSAYRRQIELAIQRGDGVSVNHRVAALLASYFDIIFAVNRQTHPGEKRMLAIAERRCTLRPVNMTIAVNALLRAAGSADSSVLAAADALIAGIDDLLRARQLL